MDTQTPDSLRPGALVGPWQVEGYAGRGSYGVVYRARRAGQPQSKPVALKIAVFPSDPRFHREVELLSRHHHPGMPQLLDQGVWHASAEAAHPYFVMEWIRGRSLYEWARVHNPTCREVLRVLAQVARALEVLHRGECLHRDVKGDNLLVEPEGRAVLMDFGSGTWKGAPPLTERVIPPNTREYRSPESLRFEWAHWHTQGAHYKARPADDLYALGVAAYRLVTGVYPPPGTEPEALKEQLHQPPARRLPAHEFNKRVAPELSALIERLLAKEPDARGTARELAEATESAAEHARPEANVPFLELERPEAQAHAAGLAKPAMPHVHKPSGRSLGALAVVTLVLVLWAWWVAPPTHPQENTSGARQEAAEADKADAGPVGLGEAVVSASTMDAPAPSSREVLAEDALPEPLPGQTRPDAKGRCPHKRQVALNMGCWVELEREKCEALNGHVYKSTCYVPVIPPGRPPTSQPARQQ
ncbi:MAG TPA: serine/threonine-protein kinase [Hyalangium sp.]|nr:serine/threonine-protein kinase [Hyalangium sp.]